MLLYYTFKDFRKAYLKDYKIKYSYLHIASSSLLHNSEIEFFSLAKSDPQQFQIALKNLYTAEKSTDSAIQKLIGLLQTEDANKITPLEWLYRSHHKSITRPILDWVYNLLMQSKVFEKRERLSWGIRTYQQGSHLKKIIQDAKNIKTLDGRGLMNFIYIFVRHSLDMMKLLACYLKTNLVNEMRGMTSQMML